MSSHTITGEDPDCGWYRELFVRREDLDHVELELCGETIQLDKEQAIQLVSALNDALQEMEE